MTFDHDPTFSSFITFDWTWYFIYQVAYVLMETLQFSIRSSHHMIQQSIFLYLFCHAQLILLQVRS